MFRNSKTKPKQTVIPNPRKVLKQTRDHQMPQPTEQEKFEEWASQAIIAQMDLSSRLIQATIGLARILKLDTKKYEEFSSDTEANNKYLEKVVALSQARSAARMQERDAQK